jgi:hypothetical protein
MHRENDTVIKNNRSLPVTIGYFLWRGTALLLIRYFLSICETLAMEFGIGFTAFYLCAV